MNTNKTKRETEDLVIFAILLIIGAIICTLKGTVYIYATYGLLIATLSVLFFPVASLVGFARFLGF